MSDDLDDLDPQGGPVLVGIFVRTSGAEREQALAGIRKILPAWIRVYDQGGLRVYHDEVKTPLPPWLQHAAVYVEMVRANGTAKIKKGGLGPTELKKTTEPRILSALDRVLNDDLFDDS